MKTLALITVIILVAWSPLFAESNESKLASEILMLINRERTSRNLALLQGDEKLQKLADQWAERSARLNRMEHRKNLSTLQKSNGFSYLNENIYRFSVLATADRVCAAWMKSQGHKKNLLSPRATLGAVAVGFTAKGGTIVVFQGGSR